MNKPNSPARCPIPLLFRKEKGVLSTALKSRTQTQHDKAETHPLHAILFGSAGEESARRAYQRLLGQHLRIQSAFEPSLRRAASAAPWGRVIRAHHFHLDALRQDCADLGVDGSMQIELPATARFIACIEASSVSPASGLLGIFYVFEGSTNGGTIIAKRVRELLRLEGDAGTRFINPHGALVRPRWNEWKQELDGLKLDERVCEGAIAGAAAAFEHSHGVLDDVHRELGRACAPQLR